MLTMIARVENIASAAREWDDLPPVLFTGSGSGHKRAGRAEGALEAFLRIVKRDGRAVVFDRISVQEGALEEAVSLAGFDTARLLARRQVCVLRRIDELPADRVSCLKRLADSSRGKWWIMSAAAGGNIRALAGSFLISRTTKREAEAMAAAAAPSSSRVPRIAKVQDVAAAVASGATIPELVEAFRRHAIRHAPPHHAVRVAARLDVDLKTNRRPLMISTLIEDALRDLDIQIPGSW